MLQSVAQGKKAELHRHLPPVGAATVFYSTAVYGRTRHTWRQARALIISPCTRVLVMRMRKLTNFRVNQAYNKLTCILYLALVNVCIEVYMECKISGVMEKHVYIIALTKKSDEKEKKETKSIGTNQTSHTKHTYTTHQTVTF